MDVLTRYPIFIPVTDVDVTARTTIRALEQHIYPLSGTQMYVMISDEGATFKSAAMESHCDRFGIYQDIVSPGNHKANGLAKRYVGTLHDAMTHLEDDKLPRWHTLCEPIAHCLRVAPCLDTLVSRGKC